MNQLKKDSSITTSQVKVIGAIDPTYVDTTYIPEVVFDIGKRSLMAELNMGLDNSRFQVAFDFKKVKRTFMKEDFSGLALFYHKLVLPKTSGVLSTTKAIEKVFDVKRIDEDEKAITYEVYLNQGPYANTIAETIYNINHELGPVVERNMKQLAIEDYQMIFMISLVY